MEDEEPVRRGLARILAGLGYDVETAASGDEALARMAAHGSGIDVVVSDVRMPGIQGPELVRRLRAGRPDLPVVLMSGYAGTAETEAFERTGGAQILEKPFDGPTLGRAVRAALDTRS